MKDNFDTYYIENGLKSASIVVDKEILVRNTTSKKYLVIIRPADEELMNALKSAVSRKSYKGGNENEN